jgi:hypothetical protein
MGVGADRNGVITSFTLTPEQEQEEEQEEEEEEREGYS